MTLVKYNSNLEDYVPVTFSSMLDRFFNESIHTPKLSKFSPRVDILETEKAFEVQVSAPGMNKEDFQITLEDNALVVSGERKFKKEKKEANYHSIETQYGTFSRSFRLPENADTQHISAEYSNGILVIEIPKDTKKVEKSTIRIK
jgi:HSP20 family protein